MRDAEEVYMCGDGCGGGGGGGKLVVELPEKSLVG